MRLEVADVARVDAGATQGPRHHFALRARIGHRVAVGLAAVVERRSLDDAINVVAVGDRLREGLEQHRADAFGRHVAVAALAKAFALAAAGDEFALAQHQVFIRMHRHVHAAGQGQLAITLLQALARQVDRRQRRRAHGVDRHAGTVEVTEVRHPVGHRRRIRRHRDMAAARMRLRAEQLVFLIHHADENAHVALRLPGQRLAGIAGVFQRRIGALQEQALLRIGEFRMKRRHIEKHRVEFVDAVDEAAPFAVSHAGLVAVWIEVQTVVPALRGDFGDAVLAVFEVVPERLYIVGLRVASGQTDDGDILANVLARLLHAIAACRRGGARIAATPRRGRRRRLRRGSGRGRGRRRGGRRHRRRRIQTQHLLQPLRIGLDEVIDQVLGRVVFEYQRLRQGAEDLFKLAHQTHRHDRIDTVLVQRRGDIDALGRQFDDAREQFRKILRRPAGQQIGRRHRRRHHGRGGKRRGDGGGGRLPAVAHLCGVALHHHHMVLTGGQHAV